MVLQCEKSGMSHTSAQNTNRPKAATSPASTKPGKGLATAEKKTLLQPRVHTEQHSCDPNTLRETPPTACKRRRSAGRLTSSELGKFGKLQADHAAEVSATNKILLLNRIQKVVDGVRTNRGTVCTHFRLKQEPMCELRSSRHADTGPSR